jgi:hypothetical protein
MPDEPIATGPPAEAAEVVGRVNVPASDSALFVERQAQTPQRILMLIGVAVVVLLVMVVASVILLQNIFRFTVR